MPSITTYMGYQDVDIDIDDFLIQCDESDIDDIIEYLETAYPNKINKQFKGVFNSEPGLIYETQKKLFELGEHAHKFTEEEETLLHTMYKKYL